MKRKGLTLIETIIGLVIVGIAFYLLILVFITVTPRTAVVETLNKKIYLAQEKMEEYLTRSFTNVASVGAASFPGDFTNFNYQIVVTNVATSDLNTPVAALTPFKNVKVRVWGGVADPSGIVEIVSLAATYESQ